MRTNTVTTSILKLKYTCLQPGSFATRQLLSISSSLSTSKLLVRSISSFTKCPKTHTRLYKVSVKYEWATSTIQAPVDATAWFVSESLEHARPQLTAFISGAYNAQQTRALLKLLDAIQDAAYSYVKSKKNKKKKDGDGDSGEAEQVKIDWLDTEGK